MHHAVAVDFGASSGRYAAGRLVEGRIEFEVVRQIPHGPVDRGGTLYWDLTSLLELCHEAATYAEAHGGGTVGIDTWGVDHGFLDAEGRLLESPVCYRDRSHVVAFEKLAPHRDRLFALTGCQHQPFNTICQLVARRDANPLILDRAKEWMILPDLLGYLMSGERNMELTQASTTQLLGLDGQWSAEAFAIADWPVPEIAPALPGRLGGSVREGVRLAHVGSHDTASAVAGFGGLRDDHVFLNVGTWSLVGCVVDTPIATPEAAALNLTNERTVDGRVRLLKNVPGFYVITRIHEELGLTQSVPEWLGSLQNVDERVDLLHPDFFNPDSMMEACAGLAGRRPKNEAEWAGLALGSLASTVAQVPQELAKLTGRRFTTLRVGGGGSQSVAFCQALANASRLPVVAGPSEATVLGNLAMQFLAQGAFADRAEMDAAVTRSAESVRFEP
ncbi:MAG: rhamnulokinase [Fimbriimonas sp.]